MRALTLVCSIFAWSLSVQAENSLKIATFNIDATPPVGTPLAYDEMTWVDKPLSCRGVILIGNELPIVLCAVDWIGISNGGQDAFKEALAEAAHTTPSRVNVHTLHQHDAPVCDLTANQILIDYGLGGALADPVFIRQTIANAAAAVQSAIEDAQSVTSVGYGMAEVREVASNRRILGDDGKVAHTRYTTCRDPKIRAMPAGTVDPMLRLVSFWNEDTPLAVLTYFATHPQSFYRTGGANPDFPGIARELRETESGGLFHVHFNGAGGDIGAGKWNDGNKENRLLLAIRLARGMKAALEATRKVAVDAADLSWNVERVQLPPAEHLNEKSLLGEIADTSLDVLPRKEAARNLAWLRRCEAGAGNEVGLLSIGPVRILHCPGEMLVEYQLAAQAMSPDRFVCLAAYGDYGPGYICLAKHYPQGGYEASQRASRVAPSVEEVLLPAIEKLLKK